MAQKHRHNQNRKRNPAPPRDPRPAPAAAPVYERRAPIVYGAPMIVMEDEQKRTFVYAQGSWVPHSATIAECRLTCLVKELPQRVNRMIRYEVRSPLSP
ncbi:MAG: hypothetical protein ACKO38_19850 [Planctomycetota bacterium]